MPTLQPTELEISPAMLEAIRSFPTVRTVTHCGTTFAGSPLAIYATCPHCGQPVKVRAFAGGPELEDVFDAVLEWLNRPAAQEIARQRQLEIVADDA